MLDTIRQDLGYALRTIRLNAGFSAVAVVSLALASGANTAMFQLLDAVRLRTLPVHAPQQLVEVRVDDMTHARGAWLRDTALTNPIWEQLRGDREAFSGLFAWADEPIDISTAGDIRKASGLWVSGSFFHALGIQPLLGRLIEETDDRRGCGQAAGVVLSYRFWQQEFGGDRAIVGKMVALGKMRPAVIGVTPPAFFGLEVGRTFDIAIPICAEPVWHGVDARMDSGAVWWLTVMGRLRPDVSIERAAAIVRAKSRGVFDGTLPRGYPAASVTPYLDMKLVTIPAANGLSRLRAQYSQPLALLVGITGFVLLIACVNLAHLVLARTTARGREIAVRISLGASTGRLAQQLITESLLLAVAGVAAGLLVSRTLCRMLVSFLTTDATSAFLDVSIDLRTFMFLATLAILTTVLFASIPVRRLWSAGSAGAFIMGPADGRSGDGRAARRILLASQIALSVSLLTATLLFVRSLRNLRMLDAGFRQRAVVVMDINFSDLQLGSDRAMSFRRDMLDRIRASPMVEGAAEVLIVPLTGGNWNNRVWMDDSDAGHARVVMRNMIGTGYFRTLGTALLAGREFDDRDMAPPASKVVIVNERFARDFGIGPQPIGRHLWIEPTPLEPRAAYEIVGVVANTKYRDLREPEEPIVYVPMWPAALRRPTGQFVIRSSVRSGALVPSLRATIAGMDATVRASFRQLDDIIRGSLLRERLMATLAGPFGALAVILTALGLYGVFSYSVARRTREIGIRMAVGAGSRAIIRGILREAAVVLCVGLPGGALLTAATGRAASSLLFGLQPSDPFSLIVAGTSLAVVALLATYLPARRAASIDPAIALRHE